MSERIYGWLLRLYPRAFQEEYGAASRQLFRDRWNAERSFLARFRLWWDVLGDLAVSIPREYRRPASPKPVTGFRLSEEAVDAMMKGRSGLPSSMALLLYCVMGWLGNAPRLPLVGNYVLLAFAFIAGHVRHKTGARRHLLGLELILEPDAIQRKQPGSDLSLSRNEITRVFEFESGLMVSGRDQRAIWVPSRLNGFEQVRDHLAGWVPIEREEPAHHSLRLKPRYAYSLLFPAYVSAMLVRSPAWCLLLAVIAGAGLLLLAQTAARRLQGLRVKPIPIVMMLGLLAALIIKTVLVFR